MKEMGEYFVKTVINCIKSFHSFAEPVWIVEVILLFVDILSVDDPVRVKHGDDFEDVGLS